MGEHQENNNEQNKSQLQIYVEQRENEWLLKIKNLNERMKTLEGIRELQTEIVTERQIALEYYHTILRMLSALNKDYRPAYAAKYNYYKTLSQVRYNSDSAIVAQIQSDLADKMCDIEIMNNHSKYMQDTLKSIDDIIYSIQSRLQLEKIIRGYDI